MGEIIELGGRSVNLKGHLEDTGGQSNQVSLYYGLTDGGENSASWDNLVSLGSFDQGPLPYLLGGLESGVTYHYRFESNNSSAGSSSSQRRSSRPPHMIKEP